MSNEFSVNVHAVLAVDCLITGGVAFILPINNLLE
jgi:hypothetical protein